MRAVLVAAVVLLAGPPATAVAVDPGAPVSARLDPSVAGARSHLLVEAHGRPYDGRSPSAVVLAVQRGFRLDPRAAAARCTAQQANDLACPETSRIGRGSATVTASGVLVPGGAEDFQATLGFFVGSTPHAGDLAAVVVTVSEPKTNTRRALTGRVVRVPDGPFGYELRFDGPGQAMGALPPGVTVELKSLQVDVGAQRTVTHTSRVKRHGRTVRVRRRVTYALVTNPSTCAGAWTGELRASFADGSTEKTALSVPCSPR